MNITTEKSLRFISDHYGETMPENGYAHEFVEGCIACEEDQALRESEGLAIGEVLEMQRDRSHEAID